MTDPLERAHLVMPILDGAGHLVPSVTLTVLDPDNGAVLTPIAWTGPLETDSLLDWPIQFTPGIVDLWLEYPGRYDLALSNPNTGFSITYPSIDVEGPPDQQVRGNGSGLTMTNQPFDGAWIQANADGTASYVEIPLVQPHNHDGTQAGSTVLEAGSSTADAKPDQTWLGYVTGTQTGDGTGGTVLGATTAPTSPESVLAGPGTTSSGTDATVLGANSTAAANSVTLTDSNGTGVAAQTVAFSINSTSTTVASVGADLQVRSAVVDKAAYASIGTATVIPATPSGVTRPVWLLGAQNLVGGLTVLGKCSFTGANLSFFGAAPVPRQAATAFADPNAALTSLVAGLKSYGLLS